MAPISDQAATANESRTTHMRGTMPYRRRRQWRERPRTRAMAPAAKKRTQWHRGQEHKQWHQWPGNTLNGTRAKSTNSGTSGQKQGPHETRAPQATCPKSDSKACTMAPHRQGQRRIRSESIRTIMQPHEGTAWRSTARPVGPHAYTAGKKPHDEKPTAATHMNECTTHGNPRPTPNVQRRGHVQQTVPTPLPPRPRLEGSGLH